MTTNNKRPVGRPLGERLTTRFSTTIYLDQMEVMDKITSMLGKNRSVIAREALDLYLKPWKEVMEVTNYVLKEIISLEINYLEMIIRMETIFLMMYQKMQEFWEVILDMD